MLELKKVDAEDALEAFCEASNLLYSEEYESYGAFDRGELVGYCLFLLRGGRLTLIDAGARAEYGDALIDGLVRSVLGYARSCGAGPAEFSGSFDEAAFARLRAFGFANKLIEDIDKFLSTCKNCAK